MDRPQRKTRSVTLIRERPQENLADLQVEFDMYGRAIGDNQLTFAGYRGVTTRKMISILVESWDAVSDCEKEQLWLNIKNYWNIPDFDPKRTETIKTQQLKDCNNQWRTYKSRLLKLWDQGINPVEKYPYLEEDVWEKFLALKSTNEFEELRRKGSETARKNKNHARVGPSGYRRMESKWDEEAESGVTIKGHNIKSKRARHYIFARRKRNRLGQYIITRETEPLADEIIEKDIQFSQGDLEIGPRSDVLTEVLGPEHSGRTRAVGHNISLKQSRVYKRQKKTQEQQMKEKLEASVLSDSFYDKIKDRLMTDIIPMVVTSLMQHNEETNVSRVKTTSVGSKTSTTVLDELHNITDGTKCELMLPYGTVRLALARGTVYPFGDGLIHTVPLEEGHLRVSIDHIYEKYHSFILTVSPNEEVHSLGEALHSYIQWPRDSIRLVKKDNGLVIKPVPVPTQDAPILRDQVARQMPSVGSRRQVPQVQKRKRKGTVKEKPMPKKADSRSLIQLLHAIREPFSVVSEPGIFKATTVETSISPEAIIEMLNREQLDISCILWYQMMLHSMMNISRMGNKCGFINPQEITSTRCVYDDEHKTDNVIKHLVDVMEFHREKQYFLAPYWEREHWMLIVICPDQYKSYTLDSARGSKKLKDYTIVTHVKTAVTRFKKNKTNKSRMRPMSWIFPKCNQQLSDWECGYYVMNWMHEFMLFRQHNFPNNIWNDTAPFSSGQLDERVNTWVNTFGKKYLK